MKKLIICFLFSLAAAIGMNPFARADTMFDIQRIRIVPNPAPGLIEGEEVLEVTFILHAEGWVPGVGWSLRYYDRMKNRLATWKTAYFSAEQNNLYLLKGDYLKGEVIWVVLFPILDPATTYMTIAIGNGFSRNVQLFPYTALLQDFNIPITTIDQEIVSSNYIILEEEDVKFDQ